MSYRLDNRYGAGEAKNSDEKQIVVSQRNATTKARKQASAISSRRLGAISTLLPI
jgi:hypothetical protein